MVIKLSTQFPRNTTKVHTPDAIIFYIYPSSSSVRWHHNLLSLTHDFYTTSAATSLYHKSIQGHCNETEPNHIHINLSKKKKIQKPLGNTEMNLTKPWESMIQPVSYRIYFLRISTFILTVSVFLSHVFAWIAWIAYCMRQILQHNNNKKHI